MIEAIPNIQLGLNDLRQAPGGFVLLTHAWSGALGRCSCDHTPDKSRVMCGTPACDRWKRNVASLISSVLESTGLPTPLLYRDTGQHDPWETLMQNAVSWLVFIAIHSVHGYSFFCWELDTSIGRKKFNLHLEHKEESRGRDKEGAAVALSELICLCRRIYGESITALNFIRLNIYTKAKCKICML